jgi:hypothetical protein
MIKDIIDLLTIEEYYGVSKTVDIAKGKYEYPTTWKGLWEHIKRTYYGKKA